MRTTRGVSRWVVLSFCIGTSGHTAGAIPLMDPRALILLAALLGILGILMIGKTS